MATVVKLKHKVPDSTSSKLLSTLAKELGIYVIDALGGISPTFLIRISLIDAEKLKKMEIWKKLKSKKF